MLKSDLVQTYKHSIKILLRRKNLRFLSRTNHYTNTLATSKFLKFSFNHFYLICTNSKRLPDYFFSIYLICCIVGLLLANLLFQVDF